MGASTLRLSFGVDRGSTGVQLAGEALEMASVESGWAEFDQLMHAVCAGAEALVRLQIPDCNESCRASLTKSVQDHAYSVRYGIVKVIPLPIISTYATHLFVYVSHV